MGGGLSIGPPFAFLAATLRKALLGGGHADGFERDNVGNLFELLGGVMHRATPLGKTTRHFKIMRSSAGRSYLISHMGPSHDQLGLLLP